MEGDRYVADDGMEFDTISIHSLRVEGDALLLISPTVGALNFNPLPPCGGRLFYSKNDVGAFVISIHSLRVEGDAC